MLLSVATGQTCGQLLEKKINEINDFNLFFNMINVFFIDILLIGNLNQSDQIDYKCINSCI
jgi:hypothetical protein